MKHLLNRYVVALIYKIQETQEVSPIRSQASEELALAGREKDRNNPCMFNMNTTHFADPSRNASGTSIH
ncbi:hypothetical protein RISK_002660 [Rhodopirellula islandica]|uniref:Uncharacterized protein n=1 Tax=Rhodopirellula islandica TaxID=595434 RepID=A0A0J1BFE5_RHOIS|nr:hypothetical protein [Rhodopirellula islandica]KLU05297.1 hypothetical protein RISK_002660 [Rhodopirellula islandica]